MRKWIGDNFYDPAFAIATAWLSLLLFPLWWLLTGTTYAATWATGVFGGTVMILMLWVSHSMTTDD